MRYRAAFFFILMSLIAIVLVITVTGATAPGDGQQAGPLVTIPELNVTDADIGNRTIPAGYEVSPTPVRVDVRISDTSLPAPKGEMAEGPRSIGFSFDPVSLVVVIIVIIAGAAGAWYLAKRKPGERDEDE
ncbi:MAG: hypothetical protein PHT99_08945 [Methanoregula sp.]|nr:hypothetical protein [Methanoregula sp.]